MEGTIYTTPNGLIEVSQLPGLPVVDKRIIITENLIEKFFQWIDNGPLWRATGRGVLTTEMIKWNKINKIPYEKPPKWKYRIDYLCEPSEWFFDSIFEYWRAEALDRENRNTRFSPRVYFSLREGGDLYITKERKSIIDSYLEWKHPYSHIEYSRLSVAEPFYENFFKKHYNPSEVQDKPKEILEKLLCIWSEDILNRKVNSIHMFTYDCEVTGVWCSFQDGDTNAPVQSIYIDSRYINRRIVREETEKREKLIREAEEKRKKERLDREEKERRAKQETDYEYAQKIKRLYGANFY